MLDVGWQELLLIVALAVILIGPEELPKVMVFLGRIARRIHYVKYALTQQFDDLMREADLGDLRKSVNFEDKDFNEAEADSDEDHPAFAAKDDMEKSKEAGE